MRLPPAKGRKKIGPTAFHQDVRAYVAPRELAEVRDWPALVAECRYTVARLTERRGVTGHVFRRFCRQTVRQEPKAWLRHFRMRRAEQWLAGDLPVGEVARRLHYRDDRHFRADFGRAHGLSPRAWRILHRAWTRGRAAEPPRTELCLPNLPAPRPAPPESDFPWLVWGQLPPAPARRREHHFPPSG